MALTYCELISRNHHLIRRAQATRMVAKDVLERAWETAVDSTQACLEAREIRLAGALAGLIRFHEVAPPALDAVRVTIRARRMRRWERAGWKPEPPASYDPHTCPLNQVHPDAFRIVR
jgi:hypothetical protein